MVLNKQEKAILEALADIHISNPETRLKGVGQRILGARVGAYLNNPMYVVWDLRDKGLVAYLDAVRVGSRVILTDKGWSMVSREKRVAHLRQGNPTNEKLGALQLIIEVLKLLRPW